MKRFQFIQVEKAFYPIRLLCEVMAVSRSGFYGWVKRGATEPAHDERRLRVELKAIHQESRGTYGAPRMTRELHRRGIRIGHNRVAKLMRTEGLHGLPRKRFRHRAAPQRRFVCENLLQRDFLVSEPNKAWVGDITYIWTPSGWLYLAVLIDLFSRRVVGWAVDEHFRTSLCLRALKQAIVLRRPNQGLVHHTDRGSQYTSDEYAKQRSKAGLRPSYSHAGDCWDNAVAESFFGTLKTELIHRRTWRNQNEVEEAIRDYIHNFYNSKRQHSTNRGLSPIDRETDFFTRNKSMTA